MFLLLFWICGQCSSTYVRVCCCVSTGISRVLVCIFGCCVFYLISKETTMYGDELHLNKVRTTHSFSSSLSLTHFQLNTCVLNWDSIFCLCYCCSRLTLFHSAGIVLDNIKHTRKPIFYTRLSVLSVERRTTEFKANKQMLKLRRTRRRKNTDEPIFKISTTFFISSTSVYKEQWWLSSWPCKAKRSFSLSFAYFSFLAVSFLRLYEVYLLQPLTSISI